MVLSPFQRRRNYEQNVLSLASLALKLRARGWTEQRVARALVDRRNRLKIKTRFSDEPDLVAVLEMRNQARYGNPIGPDADLLYRKYGSWAAVIEAACRPARLSEW